VIALLAGILMLATFALTVGGCYMLTKGNDRKRGALMLAAAVVMFGNVLIMTM
jgi:hypothetical protein